jgi:hypothetical protein
MTIKGPYLYTVDGVAVPTTARRRAHHEKQMRGFGLLLSFSEGQPKWLVETYWRMRSYHSLRLYGVG